MNLNFEKVYAWSSEHSNERNFLKMKYFWAEFFQKVKALNFIERKCDFFLKEWTTVSLKYRKKEQKYITFWKLKIMKNHLFILRIIGQVINRGQPAKITPNYTAIIKHRELYKSIFFGIENHRFCFLTEEAVFVKKKNSKY